ncbi:Mitochondrial GTPase [Tulasnella sp. 419]|nr:Mitochondrial GTPase [Tulasnella sp. 419]
MPNIGKSTLLNNLRWAGTSISTKALRTSAQPGLTRALSERLKLNLDPPIYAVDSPGVMVPFLGRGDEGRERGVKLALIAGIKESLYDVESLAAYLLYKLNRLNPENPAYLPILPKSAQKPVQDLEEFLYLVAERLGSIRKGGEYDLERTARWFVGWWREGKASQWPETHGWGFDFDFSSYSEQEGIRTLQEKMDEYVSRYVERMRSVQDGIEMSPTREKRLAREEKKKARDAKRQAAYEAKKLGSGVAKKPT